MDREELTDLIKSSVSVKSSRPGVGTDGLAALAIVAIAAVAIVMIVLRA